MHPQLSASDEAAIAVPHPHADAISPTVDSWMHGERIYLADGKGRMVFEAALSETEQIPRLLDKLSHAE